jgi:hypothetical protein
VPIVRCAADIRAWSRLASVDAAREAAATHALARFAGATASHDEMVVLRVLAPLVEPAMTLLVEVWARWRQLAWGMTAHAPRVWKRDLVVRRRDACVMSASRWLAAAGAAHRWMDW